MRTWILQSLIVACLVVATASPAFAADGGEKPGLFDSLNFVTVGVSIGVFILLLIVLSKTAWKPILEGLQKREETIRSALDEAEEAHTKAKALIAEYEGKIDHAREEGQAILEEARRDAQDLRAQIEADAQQRADETVERSKREVEQVFHKAWDDLVKDAADVATQAASQIIQQQLSPEGHAAIVSSVVSDLAARSASRQGGGA